jgi:hypothetical protein
VVHRLTAAANIAASDSRTRRENIYLTALVRRLTLEIVEHRAAHAEMPASLADERLWAALDTLHMPRGEKPIGEIVASGRWYWCEDEHPLDGEVE